VQVLINNEANRSINQKRKDMASNTKHRKNHKQKLAARKARIGQEQAKAKKYQREFLMNLIKQEQERGLFENNPSIDGPVIDGPMIDGPVIDEPTIDGPVID
jgi:hypothetical protein